eukprot:scaffold20674_cov22-Tisochrysis_lutea.AAC.1
MASGALLEERASDEVAIPDPQTAAAWFKGMKRDRSLEAEAKGIPRTFPLSAACGPHERVPNPCNRNHLGPSSLHAPQACQLLTGAAARNGLKLPHNQGQLLHTVPSPVQRLPAKSAQQGVLSAGTARLAIGGLRFAHPQKSVGQPPIGGHSHSTPTRTSELLIPCACNFLLDEHALRVQR